MDTVAYRVPWDRPEVPQVIQTAKGRLTLGIGYTLSYGNRFIDFYVSPDEYFPDGKIHVEKATAPAFSLAHKLLGFAPMEGALDPLVETLCTDPTDIQYRKALAIFAGARVFNEDTFVTHADPFLDGYIYRGPDSELYVPYPHTPLQTNRTYPEGYVIGKTVDMYPPTAAVDTQWWGYTDPSGNPTPFSDYLQLINFFPISGRVVLQNRAVDAYSIYTDVAGSAAHTHIRFPVYEDRVQDDRFWAYVWQNETSTGRYLNTLAGLPAPPESRSAITGAPECWAEVEFLHTQSRYFEHLYNIPETIPELNTLPSNLRKPVNGLQLLMESGFRDYLLFFRMNYRDVHERIENLSIFLHHTKPLDRYRYVELVRDPEELTPEPIIATTGFAVLNRIDLNVVLQTYNWVSDVNGYYPVDANMLPEGLMFYMEDETDNLAPVEVGTVIDPTVEFLWQLVAGDASPTSAPITVETVAVSRIFDDTLGLSSTTNFEIEAY
jgi:hypothetical protein